MPSVGTYLLSFALVGRFWVVHHGLFQRVRAFDGRLMALNLLFLALIVLVPFAAELDDRYTSESLAVAVFGTVLGLTALVNWMMRMHVERAGLVDRRQPQTDRAGDRFSLWLAVTFLVSVPVAFLSVSRRAPPVARDRGASLPPAKADALRSVTGTSAHGEPSR